MSEEPPDWLPSADDVALLLSARTKDSSGAQVGTWSEDTRPTEDDVELLIAFAARELVGDEFDGPCTRLARTAIGYHTACLIELSYFPEQVRSDRSPYDELKTLADAAAAALARCVASGTGPGGETGGEGYAYHSLPVLPAIAAAADGWRSPEFASTWQRQFVPPSDEEPAGFAEPEAAPRPLPNIVAGHPSEGDIERNLPPINTGSLPPGLPPLDSR